jgi:orotidine-5'-phosphate decarboxylase
MATVHVLAGPAVLAAAVAAAGAPGATRAEGQLALVGVTVLTSHDTGDFERVVGRGVPDLGFEAERLARLAVAAGLVGVVASGEELTLLREALGPNPWLVVPGIRAADEATRDQKRTVTAAEAVRRGATHLVVGRPITQAKDAVRAYQQLRDAMASELS